MVNNYEKVEVAKLKVSDFQVWSEMDAGTYEQFEADINEHGQHNPIIVDEEYVVLDGHHRLRALKKLNIQFAIVNVQFDLSEDEKLEIAYRANSARRNITQAERKAQAFKLRKDHKLPYRKIAEHVGVGKSTIERWLNETSDSKPDKKKAPSKGEEKLAQAQDENLALRKEIQTLKEQKRIQERTIERLEMDLLSARLFAGGSDNGLRVFAQFVGEREEASATEIRRSLRKAQGKAHPDNPDSTWLSQRYNASRELFEQLYKEVS
ncbi:ParB-like chromosome segregation protein Spo0J [Alkalihalobacillus xiaoxiensis]|uniref:ParB-like chromosome segregation protein Spo0J n=1 Tax=Shouchella xiaoxiensis TaxID=766895 RepID=A0ABS2SV36_9BACI|nr:ParB-like chromosome segregation protein Spo0J [Shouchella xiaoxiensis]